MNGLTIFLHNFSPEKSYTSNNEETVRKQVWMNTRNRVLDHNMLADKGKSTFRMGMNHFSDMVGHITVLYAVSIHNEFMS